MSTKIEVKTITHLQLSSEDFRLVIAALHQGLSPEQQEPALALQRKFVLERAKQLRQMSDFAEKYAENVK